MLRYPLVGWLPLHHPAPGRPRGPRWPAVTLVLAFLFGLYAGLALGLGWCPTVTMRHAVHPSAGRIAPMMHAVPRRHGPPSGFRLASTSATDAPTKDPKEGPPAPEPAKNASAPTPPLMELPQLPKLDLKPQAPPEETISAQVSGNRVRILAGDAEVVNLEVVIQKPGRQGLVTRRDLVAATVGAGSYALLTRLPGQPFPLPATKTTGNGTAATVAVAVRTDILPPQSAFLDALRLRRSPGKNPHTPEFVVYLTGFLLNFDAEWTTWWQDQKKRLPFAFAPIYKSDPVRRAAYVKEQFGDMATAVREEVSRVTARDLSRLLVQRYEGSSPQAKHQLAVLFSLLDATEQPKDVIARILSEELAAQGQVLNKTALIAKLGTREAIDAADKSIVRLPGQFTPPTLLPNKLFPLFDSGEWASGRWLVPAVDQSPKDLKDGAFLTFGGSNLGREDAKDAKIDLGFNFTTILLLALAGGAATCFTNSALHPLENLKVRSQATMRSRAETTRQRTFVENLDWGTLWNGILATMICSALYGLSVYPSFELGKLWLSAQVDIQDAVRYRLLFVLTSSILATTLGCFVSSPFEAAKIRGIADPSYERNAFLIVLRIVREEGIPKLFAGYPPYAFRNIVFSIVKFSVFDYFWDFVTYVYPTVPFAESALGISFVKGAVAGVLGACVSQPLDVLLTKVAKNNENLSLVQAAGQVWEAQGFRGFFYGLRFRALAAATIISLQFSVYDAIKSVLLQDILRGLQ
eukprot:EG_transcript_3341